MLNKKEMIIVEIHVSQEYQQVVVPKGDKLYLFGRCGDCDEMCYAKDADIQRTTEDAEADEGAGAEAEKLETDISKLSEQLFASYLIGVQ